MLSTIINIGKTFKKAGKIFQHRYIRKAPIPDGKKQIKYYSIPVDNDWNILFEDHKEITNENQIHTWSYLDFKTSDKDTYKKTLFGDIYRYLNGNKEGGVYRSSKLNRTSSLDNADKYVKKINNDRITKFHTQLKKNVVKLENILNKEVHVYVHFNFNGKSWFECLEEYNVVISNLESHFASETDNKYVLDKNLYRSICSGNKKNDIQFPNFSKKKKYRSVAFTTEDLNHLFYGVDYAESSNFYISKDIDIVVLPKSSKENEQLPASTLIDFKNRELKEGLLKSNKENTAEYTDKLFAPFLVDLPKEILLFDTIFVLKNTNVRIDSIEIAGLQKSCLKSTSDRISKKRHKIIEEAKKESVEINQKKFTIYQCYKRILSDNTQSLKKYQSHLLKVLPQIYLQTYYKDDLLLPRFINKVQENIRNENYPDYNDFKYNYYFLVSIRNNKGDDMQKMFQSNSYKIGKLLGQMAKPLSQKIASFEKNYVGMLSRRISTTREVVDLSNYLNEKINIHGVAYKNLKDNFMEIKQLLSEMQDHAYNKEFCAFGFFEGYYSKHEKTSK